MKKLFALFLLTLSFSALAQWLPPPTAAQGTWNGYDVVAYCALDDGNGTGLAGCFIVQRPTGTNVPWFGIGDQAGEFWAQGGNGTSHASNIGPTWQQEVASHGGFQAWYANVFLVLLNTKLTTWATTLTPVVVPGDPNNLANFIIWVDSHLQVISTPTKPVAEPK